MGAIAEGLVAFAQPLLDQTDGSPKQVQKAMDLAVVIYNLGLLPKEERGTVFAKLQEAFNCSDEQFEQFRISTIEPMLARRDIMSTRPAIDSFESESTSQVTPRQLNSNKKYANTKPHDPCPCNSGKKYKFCCAEIGR
jgi:uncharacterized protein YecA (UPF0149 family)